MCFDSKAVDDPKRSSSIEFLQGEYFFCLARLCMTRNCRTCYLTKCSARHIPQPFNKTGLILVTYIYTLSIFCYYF